MSEMNTRFQHLPHGHARPCISLLVGLSLHAPHAATRLAFRRPRAPGRMRVCVCGFRCQRGRALYHKFPADQTLATLPGGAEHFPTMHHPEAMSRAEDRLRTGVDQGPRRPGGDAGRRPPCSRGARHDRSARGPGVSTEELDRICHDYIVDVQRAIPAPLGYRGFPKSICTSVNHVVCHGIPGDRRLKQGDIVNVDVTVIKEGFHGDSSRMYCGRKDRAARPAADPTSPMRRCGAAYAAVRPGARLGDIGYSIQRFVEANHYTCRARVLRARHRSRLPRGSAGAPLRSSPARGST